eukprot:gene10346-1872_t
MAEKSILSTGVWAGDTLLAQYPERKNLLPTMLQIQRASDPTSGPPPPRRLPASLPTVIKPRHWPWPTRAPPLGVAHRTEQAGFNQTVDDADVSYHVLTGPARRMYICATDANTPLRVPSGPENSNTKDILKQCMQDSSVDKVQVAPPQPRCSPPPLSPPTARSVSQAA